jgi:hypothetical protein
MGFKHPELFISDPRNIPPQAKQAPPNPDVIKIQAEAQGDKEKRQLEGWKEQFRADTEKALEQIRQQGAIAVAQLNNQTKERIEVMKIQANAQVAIHGDNTEQQVEAIALDAKRNEISAAETILALKKQLDTAVNQEKEKVSVDNDARLADHTSALMKQVAEAGGGIVAQINDVAQLLAGAANLLSQQVEQTRQSSDRKLKPRKFSIENAKTDEDGRLLGGEIMVQ